ncbi:MAG: MFS transporter, partial [Sphingomonadaceae bacterium]|nr:MFS transporter [Sphingomonadaceae bacterium]
AFASLPLARLAERGGRTGIIAIGIAAWSLATMACGAAANFWQLLLARMGVGVGEAVQPAMIALIADKVPPARRATMFAIYNMSIPLGAFAWAAGGGLIAASIGWRWAFVIAGAPGLALALLFRLTVRDAPVMHQPADIPSIGAVARHLLRKKSFVHGIGGILIATFCVFGIQYFLPAWLMRAHGFDPAQAGLTLGLLSSLPAMLSMMAGGLLADRLARRDARFYVWLPAALLTLCVPIYLIALPQADWRAAMIGLLLIAFLQYSQTPLLSALTQNMVSDRMRATASSLVGIVTNLFAAGCGPVFVGAASDFFAGRAYAGDYARDCATGASPACAAAGAEGLTTAMMMAAVTFLWAVLHLILAARWIREDLAEAVPAGIAARSS